MTIGFIVKAVTRFTGFPNAEASVATDISGPDLSLPRQEIRWSFRVTASDRIRVPARHVHGRVPNMRRRTRRSAFTIGGGTPDMTIEPAAADQAGARPYLHRYPRTRP